MNCKFIIHSGDINLWELHLDNVSDSLDRKPFFIRNVDETPETKEILRDWLEEFLSVKAQYAQNLNTGFACYEEIILGLEQVSNEIIKYKLDGEAPPKGKRPKLPPGFVY